MNLLLRYVKERMQNLLRTLALFEMEMVGKNQSRLFSFVMPDL
jgi:hypothetical protein